MSRSPLRGPVAWALMAALTLGVGAIAQAQNNDNSDGDIVTIGRADSNQARPNLPPPDDSAGASDLSVKPQIQVPQHWIGLLGGAIQADNPLRAQLDLPENQGLIVENVVPDSPAAKAGLKQYDILLQANGKELHEMQDLVEQVLDEGAKKGAIKLDVLRRNKHVTVSVTPAERPANASVPRVDNFGNNINGFGDPRDLIQQFGGHYPFEFRNFGPGVIVGGNGVGSGIANMPNGVSVSIQKENNEPAHITVKRGNDTWNIVGDDPESLKQLPEDLRPFVERMLQGNGMNAPMPKFDHQMGGPGFENRFQDRMQRMEQRLEQMQKELLHGSTGVPASQPNNKPEATK